MVEREILDYLEGRAAKDGEFPVRRACKRFLKKKTVTGVKPTAREEIPKKWVRFAWVEQKYKCRRCGFPIERLEDATGDHIIPLVKGGKHDFTNIQALHDRCNKRKGSNGIYLESKRTGKGFTEILKSSSSESAGADEESPASEEVERGGALRSG